MRVCTYVLRGVCVGTMCVYGVCLACAWLWEGYPPRGENGVKGCPFVLQAHGLWMIFTIKAKPSHHIATNNKSPFKEWSILN